MSERERYWRGAISRQAGSGLTVVEFCEREGVSTASFYQWRQRLREGSRPQGRSDRPLFVPVTLEGLAERPRGPAVEVCRADGQVLRIFDGASRQTISDVLAVLEARPC